VQLDDRVWTISSQDGQLEIKVEVNATPAASLCTDPETLNGLLLNPGGLDAAIATGAVHAEGQLAALRRLVQVAT
jgi:gamma-glutamylcysteine synthetase